MPQDMSSKAAKGNESKNHEHRVPGAEMKLALK
jgi:hypothetical protein